MMQPCLVHLASHLFGCAPADQNPSDRPDRVEDGGEIDPPRRPVGRPEPQPARAADQLRRRQFRPARQPRAPRPAPPVSRRRRPAVRAAGNLCEWRRERAWPLLWMAAASRGRSRHAVGSGAADTLWSRWVPLGAVGGSQVRRDRSLEAGQSEPDHWCLRATGVVSALTRMGVNTQRQQPLEPL